tara:strand:- start:231 stop:422 length:192 start_codon:yes stop_codon:yes gene_type:complete
MEDLKKKRAALESKLISRENAHYAKGNWASESAYRDSVKEIREVYDQLFDVAYELGDPIPVWL